MHQGGDYAADEYLQFDLDNPAEGISGEAISAKGDSGGPLFIRGTIAGVASGGSVPTQFGSTAQYTRIRPFVSWIDSTTDASHQLVIDMNNQLVGNDGKTDRIELTHSNGFISLRVNGITRDLERDSKITSIVIRGSSDDDNVTVPADLAKFVQVDGRGGSNYLIVANSTGASTTDLVAGGLNVSAGGEDTVVTYSSFQRLAVNGDSRDIVRVHATRFETPVSVNGVGTVTIGGSLQNMRGPVSILGGATKTDLTIDDIANTQLTVYTVFTDYFLAYPSGSLISIDYSDLRSLKINGGSGGTFVEVKGTPSAPVSLNTGTGKDSVYIEGTTGPLTVDGQDGPDVVNIGLGGSVRGIGSKIFVTNTVGYSAVTVDDSADKEARTVIVYTNYVLNLPFTVISGFPLGGDITLFGKHLSSLAILAGSGGNTFRIHNTPFSPTPGGLLTTVNTGTGNDLVTVDGTSGALTVNGKGGLDTVNIGSGGSVRGINGQLTVTNAGNYSAVVVDDSADSVARTAIVYTNRPSEGSYTVISGLIQGGDILLRGADLSSLTIQTGNGGNTFRIHDTPISAIPGGLTTTVITGDGNDLVTVDGTTGALSLGVQKGNNQINFGSGNASLDAIQGAISLGGPGGTNFVTIDDHLSTANQILTHTISTPLRTRSAPTYTRTGAAPLRLFDVSSFDLMAGSAADTINVRGRPATSKGIADFTVEGGPGQDIFNIGNAANQLTGIGTVLLDGQSGVDVLNVLDQGTTTPAVYAFSLNFGVAPQFSNSGALLLYGNMENQSLFGGSGGNTFKLAGIKLTSYAGESLTTIHTGTGDDLVTVSNPLDVIKTPLSIDGQGGDDRLILNDSKATTGQNYAVLPGSIKRSGAARISFGALEHLDVTGTPFDDSFRIGDATHALDGLLPEITLNGNGGVNTLDYSAYPAGGSALSIPGIVSWYKGEGTADDAVGANNGTLVNGATFAPGMVGQAFSFDGIDDYVDLGNAASLDIPGSLTIEAWVNYTTLDSYKYLVADFTGGGTSQGSIGILDNSHFFWYQSMTDGSSIQVEGAMPLVAGQWYHVAAVRDDVAKTITLYVNGVEDGRASYAGTAVALQQTKVVGTSQPVGFPGDFFHGRIDEPSIYSRPLTAAEIKSISDAGSAGKSGGSSEGVTVNLALGTATGINGGVTNFRNVNGSAGNDILTGGKLGGVLMGGAGDDTLTGGGGRNILVGGSGLDTLFGNRFGDILIGGRLSYYDEAAHRVDQVAVNALLAEWSRTDLDYQGRVDHLNGTVAGGLNGPYLLNDTTIFDDGFLDGIFVGPGKNWLLNS